MYQSNLHMISIVLVQLDCSATSGYMPAPVGGWDSSMHDYLQEPGGVVHSPFAKHDVSVDMDAIYGDK
jgi:hypothetical protein